MRKASKISKRQITSKFVPYPQFGVNAFNSLAEETVPGLKMRSETGAFVNLILSNFAGKYATDMAGHYGSRKTLTETDGRAVLLKHLGSEVLHSFIA